MAFRFIPTVAMAAALLTVSLPAAQAQAPNPWRGIEPEPPGETAPEAPPAATPPADLPEPDWSLLSDDSPTAKASLREKRSSLIVGGQASSWSAQDNAGAAELSVKQSVTPFWDTRVGADLTVARQQAARSASDAYRRAFGDGTGQATSGGSAWAAMTAPGVASVWDKTSIEARIDPGADQSKIGTSFSKSVPLAGNQYSVTVQSGYNVIQQGAIPAIGYNGRPTRSYEADQSARLEIADTGTSFIAEQTLGNTEDRWLRKIGAEQKLFGGVNVSGAISETGQGVTSKSLTAGFRHRW